MNYTNEEMCLIWLDSFLGLEYKHKQYLYNQVVGKVEIKSILEKCKDYIINEMGENPYRTLYNSANNNYFNFILEGLKKKGIVAVTIESKNYPNSLKETPFPPLVLYTIGDVSLLNSECFAVVGSRRSLPLSKNIAKNFASSLLESGFTLVTGIAEGIDQTVLETAVEKGGKVISVIASGFNYIYPTSNKELADKVSKCGLVITEHAPDVRSMPYLFPIRNRIIAGLSKGTLIVSGRIKSGTAYTAEYAVDYGRDLFAVPYSVGIESGEGCNELIKKGALLADSPKDILDFYGKSKPECKIELNEFEKEIVKTLKDGEKHIDKICSSINKKVFEIMPIISGLEIKGVISKNGVNVYGLVRNLEV